MNYGTFLVHQQAIDKHFMFQGYRLFRWSELKCLARRYVAR